MSDLTFDDLVDHLIALGTEPDKARNLAARKFGMSGIDTRFDAPRRPIAPPPIAPAATSVELPFALVIPWSELCSDNEKSVPYVQRLKNGTIVPRQKRSARYQRSFAAIKKRARSVADGRAPVAGIALEIHARVFLPSNRSGNDAINFSKCTHDALEGVVYVNDNQLHRVLWERAGIDIDRPRVEITIRRLVPALQRLTQAA